MKFKVSNQQNVRIFLFFCPWHTDCNFILNLRIKWSQNKNVRYEVPPKVYMELMDTCDATSCVLGNMCYVSSRMHGVRPYTPVVFGSVPLTCVLEAAAAGSCAGTHPPPFAAVCEFSPAALGNPGLVRRGSASPWIEPPDCWSPQLTAKCTHEVIMCGPI